MSVPRMLTRSNGMIQCLTIRVKGHLLRATVIVIVVVVIVEVVGCAEVNIQTFITVTHLLVNIR